jgi:hypothetical protein
VKVFFEDDTGERTALSTPEPEAPRVEVPIHCPACPALAPIWVEGQGIDERGRDEYRAKARHVGCGKRIGKLVVVVGTIFGIEEDERVLRGPARVY